MLLQPPRSPLFPYTTLFRSSGNPTVCNRDRHRAPLELAVSDSPCASRVRCRIAATHPAADAPGSPERSEEHTSELQSQSNLVCRLLLEKKKNTYRDLYSTRP